MIVRELFQIGTRPGIRLAFFDKSTASLRLSIKQIDLDSVYIQSRMQPRRFIALTCAGCLCFACFSGRLGLLFPLATGWEPWFLPSGLFCTCFMRSTPFDHRSLLVPSVMPTCSAQKRSLTREQPHFFDAWARMTCRYAGQFQPNFIIAT